MKPTTFQKAIQLQFECLVKRVVDTTVKDYERELGRRARHEMTFSDLSEAELNQIGFNDTYLSEFTAFEALGFSVHVFDDRLCESLKRLPDRKRNIVLMYYFLDMTDVKIAELLQTSRSTVTRNRTSSLYEIKKMIMEDIKADEIDS